MGNSPSSGSGDDAEDAVSAPAAVGTVIVVAVVGAATAGVAVWGLGLATVGATVATTSWSIVAAGAAGGAVAGGTVGGAGVALKVMLSSARHAPRTDHDRLAHPCPVYLLPYMNGDVNIGVLGASGVGKSSFVNAIRHVRNSDAIAAKVGVVETTEEPTKYHFPSPSVFTDEGQPLMCYIWDVPGAGTRKHPVETYIRDMGLRYFDLVVLMTADRFTEVENDMLDQLRRFKVPYFIVRSKIDATIHAAIVTEEDERGQSLNEEQKREIEMGIVAQLRFFFRKEQVYVISTLSRFLDQFDFRTLERDISAALASGRSIDVEQECPVCLEIYQNCGGQAGLRTVVAPCGHSICATCLQFTLNSPDPTCRMCKHLITPR